MLPSGDRALLLGGFPRVSRGLTIRRGVLRGFDLGKTVTKLDVGRCLRHGLQIYGFCQDIRRFGIGKVRVVICPHFCEEFLERVTQALTSMIT